MSAGTAVAPTGHSMRAAILAHFPARTHALTVVSDPDRLLAGEDVHTELVRRGFSLVAEDDPVLLRDRVERLRPWAPERPVVVVTSEPLNTLPYDLWQQGQHVELRLRDFFPSLAYPALRALTPAQRERLAAAPPPATPLGRQASIAHVLRHAFGADLAALRHPAGLIAWLNAYHAAADPLPELLRDGLLAELRPVPAYADWPLSELVTSAEAFHAFARAQWRGYVRALTGRLVEEEPARYVLDFGRDTGLQDGLAGLLRTGALAPVAVAAPERLPVWARAGVLGGGDDAAARRGALLLTELERRLAAVEDARWGDWQAIARTWAELGALRGGHRAAVADEAAAQLASRLDAAFLSWLRHAYPSLAGLRLPTPHHVFHVPGVVAREREGGRVALVVLDGVALRDWQLMAPVWRGRHPDWQLGERLLLAQLPTMTAVSRQALVAGRRPADFAATIGHNRAEPALWAAFWAQQELPAAACAYARFSPREPLAALDNPHLVALCLIVSDVDEIVHGARLGAADVDASLGIWLERVAPALEATIGQLLACGFTVFLASDHGHVEARGIGQPPIEGLAVESRAKRARTYRDRALAARSQATLPGTVLWGNDGVLPDDFWALLAAGRTAFAPNGELVVSHGGATFDEVVVPFVTIRTRS